MVGLGYIGFLSGFIFGSISSLLLIIIFLIQRKNLTLSTKLYPISVYSLGMSVIGYLFIGESLTPGVVLLWLFQLALVVISYSLYSMRGVQLTLDFSNIEMSEQEKQKFRADQERQKVKQKKQEADNLLQEQQRLNNEQIKNSTPQAEHVFIHTQQAKTASFFHQGVFCPSCRSLDVQFMQNKRKKFSVGKAVVGGALAGGIGTAAGLAGKKGKKNQWRCNSCGGTFYSKK